MAVPFQADIQLLRASLEAHLGTRLQSDEAAAGLPWKTGEQLTATVQAATAGNRYLLRIGDRSFDVVLPLAAAVGDQLELEFLSASPRVTFALRTGPDAGQPTPATSNAAVDISSSARNLSRLLESIGAAARTASSSAVSGIEEPLPLLPAPPAPSSAVTAHLAAGLRTSLERSGLFYESHLGEWLMGERPLRDVLHEPQGRLSPVAVHTPAENDEAQEPITPAHGPDRHTVTASANAKEDAIAPQLLPQVRAQIEALDARQIVWQGQPWPGQRIELRIEEPPDRAPDSEEPVPWTTRVRLTLPRLGEISAELVLAGPSLRVRLMSAEAESHALMRAGQEALDSALEQAGIQLTAFRIEDREPG